MGFQGEGGGGVNLINNKFPSAPRSLALCLIALYWFLSLSLFLSFLGRALLSFWNNQVAKVHLRVECHLFSSSSSPFFFFLPWFFLWILNCQGNFLKIYIFPLILVKKDGNSILKAKRSTSENNCHSKHTVTVLNYISYSSWAQVLQVFIIIISLSFQFFSIVPHVNQSVKKFAQYFKGDIKLSEKHKITWKSIVRKNNKKLLI